jgi:hypothetical protein
MGLKASVKNGISHVLSKHETVIVLEDDICVNQNFLEFHNTCLQKYKENQEVWYVSAFVIPKIGKNIENRTRERYFLAQRASSWGWSTWKDRWEQVEWDEKILFECLNRDDNYKKYYSTGGDKIRMLLDCFEKKNNSWAIIWDLNHFINKTYCLYPSRSFASNIGLDNSGVHSKPKASYNVDLKNWDFDPLQLPERPANPSFVRNKFRQINKKLYRDVLDLLRFRRLKKNFEG